MIDVNTARASLLETSPDEYMSWEQLASFRRLLLNQRAELLTAGEHTLNELREQTKLSDEADRASLEEQRSLAFRMRDRERKLLRKIDAAIARIDAGTFGWCEETGEPIGLARLLARPTATLSIDGQERKEARERGYRG